MLKARNRKLSMILVLAMLMTMFAGLGTASAAIVDYSAYGVVTVQTDANKTQALGSIVVEIDHVDYLNKADNWVTLKMPSGVKLTKGDDSVTIDSVIGDIYAKSFVRNTSTVDILVSPGTALKDGDPRFTIKFDQVVVQSGSGNLDVMFIQQSGSVLPGGSVTIANIVSKGATQAMVTSVKSLGAGGGPIDTISIGELSPGALEEGRIKLELPAGVKWTNASVNGAFVAGNWAFSSTANEAALKAALIKKGMTDEDAAAAAKANASFKLSTNDDGDILYLDIIKPITKPQAGRIDIGANGQFLAIDIDEDDAKKGDIKVKISSSDIDGVTKQDLVIAKFGEYETALIENEVTELIAGQDEQELGSFYIEEALGDSLITSRTIVFELPSGVKWNKAPELTFEKGSGTIELKGDATDKRARFEVRLGSKDTAAKILVEEGEVYVEPGFEGDVELRVTGTAGVEGTVKVAEVVKAVDISVSKVPNIIIGEQNVLAGDIIIKENLAEAIQERDIVIELAGGYEFYKEPTVKVTDGDLRIDDVDINNDKQLVITIDKESNDASTITISDVYITGYRYAPTGPVIAKFVAAKGNLDKDEYSGSTALDTLYIAPDKKEQYKGEPGKEDREKNTKYSEKSVGEVTIANCTTPAEGSGVIEFRVDSNVYYVGGNAKVMDVAPYIKGDRTYVPMRFLGEILGADVVWDDAARTVTLTKGDDVVVFTIGSTSYTVNGEALTADVAPEITNDRTMLPARFVAEAFGAVVGWDAGTRTVLIQQK